MALEHHRLLPHRGFAVLPEQHRSLSRGLRHSLLSRSMLLADQSGGARSTGTARHRLRRPLRLSRRAALRERDSEFRARPNSGEERAPLKCSQSIHKSVSCPCGEADADHTGC